MNALRPLLFLSLVSLSVLATCGGGSSKEDPVAVCKQGCSKYIDLCPDDLGGLTPAQAKAFCETACSSTMGGGKECKNASAIVAAGKMCLSKTTCDDLNACTDSIPECDTGGGTTGTGGSSGTGTGGSSGTGTGGSSGTGTGGSSGTGTGGSGATGSCATLQACCGMLTSASDKASCQAAAASAPAATCDTVIASLKAQGVTCQ